MHYRLDVTLALFALAGALGGAQAEDIAVPNGSFESPETGFVDPRINSWEKTPKPFWYEEDDVNKWDNLTGVFLNTEPGLPDHIDNLDGNQAVYLFAIPEVGFFQDSRSAGTPVLDAQYEVGETYRLRVGLIGGLGGMLEGTSLSIGLYYREAETNRVTVASTNVVFSAAVFTNATHLVDFEVVTPPVSADDPWAEQPIGIEILSTVRPELATGGYWDLDNVRLATVEGPILSTVGLAPGQRGFVLESEPGLVFEVLGALDVGLPVSAWGDLGRITNATGTVTFIDENADEGRRFYQTRLLE